MKVMFLMVFTLSLGFGGCVTQGDKGVAECPIAHDSKVDSEHSPDQLLVRFGKGASEQRINAINEAMDAEVIGKMLGGRLHQILIPKGKSLEATKEAYLSFPEVESVNFNYQIRPLE